MAPPPSKVVIYSYRFCPYTNVAQLALAYTDVKFTMETVDPIASAEDKEKAQAMTPEGNVPVIDWGEQRLTTVDALLTAMEPPSADDGGTRRKKKAKETVSRKKKIDAPSLFYFAEVDRAVVQKWIDFVRDDLAGPLLKVLMNPAPDVQKESRPKLAAALKKLEAQLTSVDSLEGNFLFGQTTPSAADLYLLPFLHRALQLDYFRAIQPPLSPRLQRYYMLATSAIPAFESSVPTSAELRGRLKKYIPRLPVLSSNTIQHDAIRTHAKSVLAALAAAVSAPTGNAGAEARRSALVRADDVLQRLAKFVAGHAAYEEKIFWPQFEGVRPGVTARATKEHEHEAAVLRDVAERLHRLVTPATRSSLCGPRPAARPSDVGPEALAVLNKDATAVLEHLGQHMDSEEDELIPLTGNFNSIDTLRRSFAIADPLQDDAFVLQGLNGPQLEQYVYNLYVLYNDHDPAYLKTLIARIRQSPAQQMWATLQDRLPEITALGPA